MNRIKNFDATGLAPNGRLYPGDLNAIMDAAAAEYDLSQALGAASLDVGQAGLSLIRYGAGEARLTGTLRTDGILRGLGGLFAGQFTTAQRDAIAAGSRPTGLVIWNSDLALLQVNKGTDAAPSWQTVGASSMSGTYAARPGAATVPAGTYYFCTDWKCILRSDGANWTRMTPAQTAKVTPKTVNTTTAESDLLNGEITIPGGLIGPNGKLKMRCLWDGSNGSGGGVTTTWRVKSGATTVVAKSDSVGAYTGRYGGHLDILMRSLGVQNSHAWGGWIAANNGTLRGNMTTGEGSDFSLSGNGSSLFGTDTEDMSADKLIQFSVQFSVSNATIEAKLYAADIEIF